MIGIRLFPFGMAYFQWQTVSFRERTGIVILRLFQHTELEHTPSNLYQRAIMGFLALAKIFAFNFCWHGWRGTAGPTMPPLQSYLLAKDIGFPSWLVGGDTHTQTLNVWYIY